MKARYKQVVCADAFSVSIQACEGAYCTPRNDIGPYTAVELGFPSAPDSLLDGYAEDSTRPTETVYGWVPVEIASLLIVKHGGALSGTVPPGVTMLMDPHLDPKEDKNDDG
tara:strand:+ start:40 stop:372 length:333 start_codon:yes stop_codon:yes gene_type:complete